MSRDPISELIIGVKNAGKANKEFVKFPYSKFKNAVAEVLKKEGYVKSISKIGKTPKRILEIEVAYESKNTPKIKDVVRVSKLSKRAYFNADDIKSVRRGFGALIMSTSEGVMTGKEARKNNLGGEALFKIW